MTFDSPAFMMDRTELFEARPCVEQVGGFMSRRVISKTSSTFATKLVAFSGLMLVLASQALSQVTVEDYKKLRINEILSRNDTVFPQNCACRHVDMLEIYNGSEKVLPLDGALGTVRLTDRSILPLCVDPATDPDCLFVTNYLSFRGAFITEIGPGQRVVVFCDEGTQCGEATENCERPLNAFDEVHAPFRLNGNGECLVLELRQQGSESIVLHEVTYPMLRSDVSYARFPEATENTDSFVFTKSPTFGACFGAPQGGAGRAYCVGDANSPSDPLEPDVELIDFTTNNPAADESVVFRVRVIDDVPATAENLQSVELRFQVDMGDQQVVPMNFLELVDESTITPEPVEPIACSSVDRWAIWEVALPTQAAGSVVRFSFHVIDKDGKEGSDPSLPFCEEFDVGPCNINDPEGPGPGCLPGDECSAPFRLTVQSDYDGPLVLNEVVPNNDSIFEDRTDPPCSALNLNCAFDDFIELCNNSADESLSLDGLVLTDRPFRPERGWEFRPATLGPGERLIVWIDGDDQDPVAVGDPANPNNTPGEFHTDFSVTGTRDEIYILDTRANRFQVIDGIRWGRSGRYNNSGLDPLSFAASDGTVEAVARDEALARTPDCNRSGAVVFAPATPLEPNQVLGDFRRGDADSTGLVDIADPIYVILWLFVGVENEPTCQDAMDGDDSGEVDLSDPLRILRKLFEGLPIPDPGLQNCGPDPTEDELPPCLYDSC